MHSPTRIYLTGFMGSGKSTIGPLVAARLGYTYLDLDALVETLAGKPVPTLFEEEGEAVFRAWEARALQKAAQHTRVVVAVGGGALTFEETLQTALRTGTVVYLRLSAETLLQRLQQSRTERPLLRDATGEKLNGADLFQKIDTMLATRSAFYNRAQVIVEAEGKSIEKTVAAVLDAVAYI